MWQILPGRGMNKKLYNPSSSSRYGVEVTGESIRRGDNKQTFPVIDAGAEVTLDTISAFGMSDEVTITWHEQQDLSDPQQRWRSELP